MNTRFAIVLALVPVVFAASTHGQSTTPTAVVLPAPASPNAAPTVTPPTALTPNQIVYAPQLPSVTELTNAAAAQGLAIDKIEQTNAQITVVYRNANGQTNTVAYLLLPAAGTAGIVANPVATPSTPPPTAVYAPTSPTVVYEPAPQSVYYDYYGPGYYPYYWYPPVSFRVGLGFGYHSGFHGGFRGGYRGFHR